MGDIINIDEVKTIITENTEKIKYIDYISHLAQALGLTEYGISHHDAWHPHQPACPETVTEETDRASVAPGIFGTWLLHE